MVNRIIEQLIFEITCPYENISTTNPSFKIYINAPHTTPLFVHLETVFLNNDSLYYYHNFF